MNKIIIEVTTDGWTTKVQLNGEIYTEQFVSTHNGASTKSTSGNFEEEENIPESIYDALNSTYPFELMQALQEID